MHRELTIGRNARATATQLTSARWQRPGLIDQDMKQKGTTREKQRYRITHVDQLQEAARALLGSHNGSKIFAFYGPMGVGKTTIIKAICLQLGVNDLVSSPSFPIVNHYVSDEGDPIYHFDFYRISKQEEVYDLGYEDYFYSGNYCFIEWPEKVESLLPEDAVVVDMQMHGDERMISF